MLSPQQKYQQSSAQTATPIQLVLMLYDGAIRFTKQGIEGIQQQQRETANKYLCKAEAIIHELISSLNFDYAISKDLVRIYEYLLHNLIQANLKKEASYAVEVLAHLEQLRESWRQLSKTAVAVGN
ncbi:flagellar export chaperone FliS [Paenibacillus sp. MWE-103]|uniref:Flagellar export chaperone FliS n=1 Tax=Paenibacillus artemisiicola TaxID=1172618 RepID=A0ABS3WG59_9BACL|nr:flagellar export chaperone FliS [Paenibacillus artemisiicola]MBO7747238.1 flagellar export chaperone FliS [Paenibacillus artemisiicola]